MYIFNTKTSRCSLCYALLSTNTNPTSSTVTYSSSSLNRRYATRCSISSIERLISSSIKFERLWRKNENGLINNRSICFRCCGTIRQIEQIQNDIEQLNNDKKLLMNKIKHNLSKRAHILQGQRHQNNSFLTNHQESPLYEDDDTEEGEEKPRTVITTNGNGHSSPLIIPPPTTLVGAKRRKCNIAHKINLENKPIESPFLSFNHLKQSNTAIAQPTTKFLSPNLIFDSQSSKHHRSNLFSSGINGHDLANLSFGSSYKPLALTNTSSSSSTTTPQFLDPATGALIAIVSNPHHAALLAQQHQQILKSSSSISPSSIDTIVDHEIISTKPTPLPKKFPCLLCGRDFSNKSNLNRHHSIVHVALRNFECIRCPKKFKLRQGLKTHMQRCHGVNADEPTFVLQKHRLHNHHHHPSSPQVIAQTNK
ncbi:unnamed protein product [Rotaria socialis]|uniref:C2H2-type domain-containing protein n=1 Tax=Rotaria socialis TaxID=392032 RepID=A0A818KH74_9BILA|nr:unnamed protein product [Rotaria socialis]CAF3491067.1 unnamed protein product [Rotaria socialis]CAF3523054.1 unnamed protein product [Rotaria socialis]CAF3551657.1 unnamed protein product [Rotaria socialis]CAF4363842.1 unnamed protein product [Rotaria socialis]